MWLVSVCESCNFCAPCRKSPIWDPFMEAWERGRPSTSRGSSLRRFPGEQKCKTLRTFGFIRSLPEGHCITSVIQWPTLTKPLWHHWQTEWQTSNILHNLTPVEQVSLHCCISNWDCNTQPHFYHLSLLPFKIAISELPNVLLQTINR